MIDGPNRKQPRSFEPPPWEQDQFEELARRREELQNEAELDEALAELALQKAAAAAQQEATATEPEPAEPSAQPQREAASSEAAEPQDGLPVDEKVMEAMLTQLRMEEPKAEASLWKAGVAMSLVSATIGAILIVWGVAAILKNLGAPTGLIGGSIMVLFGALFVGIGVWMAVRSLKERGVL